MKTITRLFVAIYHFLLWFNCIIIIRAFFYELSRQFTAIWAIISGKEIFNIVIIKSSRYDSEDGFVWRSLKAILPSNTLATIYSMVKDIQVNWRLGTNIKIITREFDETAQNVNPSRIARLCNLLPSKTLVMIVGVQTNEFARASDIALDFREKGIQVIIGGFHVSGVLKQFPKDGSELSIKAHKEFGLDKLINSGVSIFAGEAEGRVLKILEDFQKGNLKEIYNYLDEKPDLFFEVTPEPVWSIIPHFVFSKSSTIDACRGCPFGCVFCTIRNVQGTKIRARGIDVFCDTIRSNWKKGINSYFFTSDNASRDPFWRERFDALIKMRQEEDIKISFMMQVDTQCHKILDFIPKASAAGCEAVFIGMETVNPDNLPEVGKGQNHVDEYQEFDDEWRKYGVATQYGYMIGLPNDTFESIIRDINFLINLGPDLITFFIATPLPGADDHRDLFRANVAMDSDANTYDCFSGIVTKHPLMSNEDLLKAYHYAWEKMYSVENMVRILKNNDRKYYWDRLWSLIWYKYALDVAQRHPMITGFIRLRNRHSRRKTFPKMNFLEFQIYNFKEKFIMWKRTLKLAKTMLKVWQQSYHKK